jgi:hypothetical protein
LAARLAAAWPRALRDLTSFRLAGARFANLLLRVRGGVSSSLAGGAASGKGTSGSGEDAAGSGMVISSIGTPSFVCDVV